ncbi:MAG TPA: TetR/AcrR family transcriptional regulator [Turneriella sp.]|nr:TetR/AcrR family transcriptional regulator [Turneriella sp.]
MQAVKRKQQQNPVSSPVPQKPSARDRIVTTAAQLFEAQGYAATGINQIIAESGTAKASFYDYFASKELLGAEYLAVYGAHHLALIRNLTERSATPRQFLSSWVKLIRRQLRERQLYGCPMANLRAQIGDESPLLIAKVRELTQATITLLADYVRQCGIVCDQKGALLAARRVFAAYEGAIHIWKLSGDEAALGDIEDLALAALNLSGNNQV